MTAGDPFFSLLEFALARISLPSHVLAWLSPSFLIEERSMKRDFLTPGVIIFAIAVYLFANSNFGGSPKSDRLLENAATKIDSGEADRLTQSEKQRISDVLNWCKQCNKPIRDCSHGNRKVVAED
jgi:hypothetical protein